MDYKLYKNAWISKKAPHISEKISSQDCHRLLKIDGIAVRNTYNFDKQTPSSFWYIIKDSFGGMDELSSKTRNCIRRANKTLDYKIITIDEFKREDGYKVLHTSFKYYNKTSRYRAPTRAYFNNLVANITENHQIWGAYHKKSGELIGYAINYIYSDICEYHEMNADSDYLTYYYPYYGMIYNMNRYYLETCGVKYVSDGSRSITNHSEIQPFLEKKFNFRKAYCDLQVEYNWWMKIAVTALYKFRKFIPNSKIQAILNMEEMKRNGI